jgi:ribosomal protein L37E
MTGGRNRGKQGFQAAVSRSCRRCGRDISSRHDNAVYCADCTGRRGKPYVHSVRLDEKTHGKLLRLVQESREKRVQPVLEGIVKSALEDKC